MFVLNYCIDINQILLCNYMCISNDSFFFSSPSFGSSDEQLAQHPALVILVISDGVVQFVAYSNLQAKD